MTIGTQAERLATWEAIAARGPYLLDGEGPSLAEARAALAEAVARSPRGPDAYGTNPADWRAVLRSPGGHADLAEAPHDGTAASEVWEAAARLGRVEAAAVAGGWSDEVARHGVPESVARLVPAMLPIMLGTGARYAEGLSALSLAARGGNAERVRRLLSAARETDAPATAAASFVDALDYLARARHVTV